MIQAGMSTFAFSIRVPILTAFIFLAPWVTEASGAVALGDSDGSFGVDWSKTYGGSYGDGAWSLQKAVDGGYILAGYTCSIGEGGDLWMIKTGPYGEEQWGRIYGGSNEEVGYCINHTRDGGYVVTGATESYALGGERLWLLKVDPSGKKEWDRTFGGFVSSSGDGGWSVCQAVDGGYIMTGYTRSYGAGGKDLWLIKTDCMGRTEWQKTFGGIRDDVGMSVVQTTDGGFAVTGRTASFGSSGDDLWLIRTDSSGRELWNKTYGGPKDDTGFQVVEADDQKGGGFVVVGRTEATRNKRALILKIDGNGSKVWEKTFEDGTVGISIQRSEDGGFVLAGRKDSTGKDGWAAKVSASSEMEWETTFGGAGDDTATSVVADGEGCVVAGITNSYGYGAEDAWLVRIDPGHQKEKAAEDRLKADNSRLGYEYEPGQGYGQGYVLAPSPGAKLPVDVDPVPLRDILA